MEETAVVWELRDALCGFSQNPSLHPDKPGGGGEIGSAGGIVQNPCFHRREVIGIYTTIRT